LQKNTERIHSLGMLLKVESGSEKRGDGLWGGQAAAAVA
jgi:hypothetical protein